MENITTLKLNAADKLALIPLIRSYLRELEDDMVEDVEPQYKILSKILARMAKDDK